MSGTRSYEFVTGIETSNIPTAVDPTASTDVISKGYADANFTPRSHVYGKVTDITALKAIGSSSRGNEQLCYVAGLNLFYEYSSASTATSDDDAVVRPNDVPSDGNAGRWLKVSFAGAGGGGGSGVEQLLQKLEAEKYGVFSEPLDNSVGSSGMVQEFNDTIVGSLLKDTASGASAIEVAWNPVFVNDSDSDVNTTSGWSTVSAASTLTTNGTTKQIGSASMQFDKSAGNTEAGIRYDRTVQTFALISNSIAQFYIYLPSITNLSDVYIKIYADTTSNYRRWTRTTDASGSALAIGWNLIRVDLSDTTGSTTGGTGWTYQTLARYTEIGVDTSSAAQTYSGILLDSIRFSLSDPQKLGLNGSEVTIYDTSTKQDLTIDVSNTLYDTRLSLKAGQTTSATYTGGSALAARAMIERMTTSTSIAGTGFNSSLTSGTIGTEQEFRMQRLFREALSSTIKITTDLAIQQWGRVRAVGASTIDIDDSANFSANYANGDVIHVFRPKYSANGSEQFIYQTDKTLTASSTHLSGVTTITCTVAGISVGDYVAKKHLSISQSLVALTANESFTAAALDASPNGIQVLDNYISYPFPQQVVCHYRLGGVNWNDALLNKKGSMGQMHVSGSPTISQEFLYGRKAVFFNNNISNYYYLTDVESILLSTNYTSVMSFWFKDTIGFNGAGRVFCQKYSGSNGWILRTATGSNNLNMVAGGAQYTGVTTYNTNTWNHVLCIWQLNNPQYVYLNGILQFGTSNNNNGGGNSSYYLYFGSDTGNASTGIHFADFVGWSNPGTFTQDIITRIYRNGAFAPFDGSSALRYVSTVSGLNGQKLSIKNKLNRTTTGVAPTILKTGAIKS